MSSPLNVSGAQRCHALMNRTQTVYQGIVNVTPDSFSDGGLFNDPERALAQALRLVEQGAKIIDLGGASTRPGAPEISPAIELQRVLPVLKVLRARLPTDVLISLDTFSPEVAWTAAQENLIDIVNDVFAARKIAQIAECSNHFPSSNISTAHVAAQFQLGLILMHMQGSPSTMQINPTYIDCLIDVAAFLERQMHFARERGVQWIAIDPGIGFGKTLEHNLQLMSPNGIGKLASIGAPLVVGLSRKSFLKILAQERNSFPDFGSPDAEMLWRDQQSALWESNCTKWGARIIRTHDIKTASRGIHEQQEDL